MDKEKKEVRLTQWQLIKKARDDNSDMSPQDRKKYLELYRKQLERHRKKNAKIREMIKKARDENSNMSPEDRKKYLELDRKERKKEWQNSMK